MVRPELLAGWIASVSRRELKDRENALQAIDWFVKNPIELLWIINRVDHTVRALNRFKKGDYDAQLYPNIDCVKKNARSEKLPILFGLFADNFPWSMVKFHRVLGELNIQMERGEKSDYTHPFLDFHTKLSPDLPEKTKYKILTTAGLVVTFDGYMAFHYHLGLPQGQITRALVETLGYQENERKPKVPQNLIWEMVANPDKLNWIDGNPAFSPKFRQMHGFR